MEIKKIKLKAGDIPARVLSVLRSLEGQKIYCQVAADFVLITELDFLKELKKLENIVFVTTKPFFRDLLIKQGFEVLDDFPESSATIPVQVVRDFLDRVAASKNTVSASEVDIVATEIAEKTNQKLKAQFTKRKIENLARERSWRGAVFFLCLGLIMGLGGLFFFISPRAEIVVKPRIDTIETTQNVIITLAGSEIPEAEKNLPVVSAIIVETEIADTETFASTLKEYEVTNASGKVSLINEDEEDKFIIPSRLVTDEGLVFRTQSDLVIPAATADGPGKLVTTIVADSFDAQERPIGDRGNIENGTDLIFPGFREDLQALYYAKADQGPLVGGSTLTRYFVGENDGDLARQIVEESFRVRGIEYLRSEIEKRSAREDKEYVLLDRANLVRAQQQAFDFPEDLIGQELNTFEVFARYQIGGVVFDQSEVVAHLQKKLRLNQDQRKKIVELDTKSVDYRLLNTEKLNDEGWGKLSVSIIGVETIDFEADNAFAQDWQDAIKREVAGKDLNQARGILVNHPEVEEVVSLTIMPFWNKFVPGILDQVDLKIKY